MKLDELEMEATAVAGLLEPRLSDIDISQREEAVATLTRRATLYAHNAEYFARAVIAMLPAVRAALRYHDYLNGPDIGANDELGLFEDALSTLRRELGDDHE